MSADLSELNEKASQAPLAGADEVPVELLARTWHGDLVWYGPVGIGATSVLHTGLTDSLQSFKTHSLHFAGLDLRAEKADITFYR